MSPVSRKGAIVAVETFHIRRIQHNAVDFPVSIGKLATVGSRLEVRWEQDILILRDILPEGPLSESDVSNSSVARDVKPKYLWKYLAIIPGVGREHQLRCCLSVWGFSFRSHKPILPYC
jgi:hypothetical protein